jgi:DNA-binding protein H-NS
MMTQHMVKNSVYNRAEIRCETEEIVSEIQTTRQRISQKRRELQAKQQAETQIQNQIGGIAESEIILDPNNGTEDKQSLPTTQSNASSQPSDLNRAGATERPSVQQSKKSLASFQIFIPQLQLTGSPRIAVSKEQQPNMTVNPSPAGIITSPALYQPPTSLTRDNQSNPSPAGITTSPALYQPPTSVTRNNHSQSTASPFVCIQQDSLDAEVTENSGIVTEDRDRNEGNNQQSCQPDEVLPDCRTSIQTPQQPIPMDTEVYQLCLIN